MLRHQKLLTSFSSSTEDSLKRALFQIFRVFLFWWKDISYSCYSFCAGGAPSLTISLKECRSSMAWPYSRVRCPPPWAACRTGWGRSELHCSECTIITTAQQHEELWQFKQGVKIFQQIMKWTYWGKNNSNEVNTAIAKYLPKEKMLVFDKDFYCYLIFIMI